MIQSPNGHVARSPSGAGDASGATSCSTLMEEQGRIDAAQPDAGPRAELDLAAITPESGDARYFLDLLRRQLSEVYDEEVLPSEGLRIYSTLDRRLQRAAASRCATGIEQLEKRCPSAASRTTRRARSRAA